MARMQQEKSTIWVKQSLAACFHCGVTQASGSYSHNELELPASTDVLASAFPEIAESSFFRQGLNLQRVILIYKPFTPMYWFAVFQLSLDQLMRNTFKQNIASMCFRGLVLQNLFDWFYCLDKNLSILLYSKIPNLKICVCWVGGNTDVATSIDLAVWSSNLCIIFIF